MKTEEEIIGRIAILEAIAGVGSDEEKLPEPLRSQAWIQALKWVLEEK